MIKVANNLQRLVKSANNPSQEAATLRTDHPFNLHYAGTPHAYYSYGNSPATSMVPEAFFAELVADGGYGVAPTDTGNMSPEDYAAFQNTLLSWHRQHNNPSTPYSPSTQPAPARGRGGRVVRETPAMHGLNNPHTRNQEMLFRAMFPIGNLIPGFFSGGGKAFATARDGSYTPHYSYQESKVPWPYTYQAVTKKEPFMPSFPFYKADGQGYDQVLSPRSISEQYSDYLNRGMSR